MLQLSLQQTDRYPRFALPVSCPKVGQSISGSKQLSIAGLLPAYPSATSWDMQPERGCGAGGCGVALSGRWILLQALKSRHQEQGWTGSPTTTAWQLSPALSPSLDPHTFPWPWLCSLALSLSAHPLSTLWVQRHTHGSPGIQTHTWHLFLSCLWLHPRVGDVEALRPTATGVDGLVSPTTGMQDGAGAQVEHGGQGRNNVEHPSLLRVGCMQCLWEDSACLPCCPQGRHSR